MPRFVFTRLSTLKLKLFSCNFKRLNLINFKCGIKNFKKRDKCFKCGLTREGYNTIDIEKNSINYSVDVGSVAIA